MAVTNADRIVREARRTLTLAYGRPLREEDGDGSNDGRLLREYLIGKTDRKGKIIGRKITGFQPGSAWCVFFAQAVIVRAWGDAPLPPQLRPSEGGATALREWAERFAQDGSAWKPGKPRAVIEAAREGVSTGAITLITDVKGDEFHAGVCLGSNPLPAIPEWRLPPIPYARPGCVWSLEGNTNDNGSAYGYKVALHERPLERVRLIVF